MYMLSINNTVISIKDIHILNINTKAHTEIKLNQRVNHHEISPFQDPQAVFEAVVIEPVGGEKQWSE